MICRRIATLLINYDTRYEQAVWFQHVYAAAILFFGSWEYFKLIKRQRIV
jgi:hypothetical protein